MPLVPTAELVAENRAALAFNVIQLEHAEAIVDGAARAGRGVILQISQNAAKYHGGLAPIALASRAVAEAAGGPVALHLDHAEREDLIEEALELGFGSVMFDAATSPYDENVARTAAVVARAHARGVWVEAELGEVGGKDGAHAPGVRTDPAEAAAFTAATGVDALAVAVGSSHAMTSRTAAIDLELIAALDAAVPVPLVLHGSSGVGDADIVAAVEHGMRKVNISTHLNKLFTAAVRDALAADERVVDPRKWIAPGREAVAAEVARLLTLVPEHPGR